jgi:hypothetical protein
MFMARSSERLSADAYTRASVEAYLQAAAEQRARIELAIAEAEKRHEAALDALERLDALQDGQAPSTSVRPDRVEDDPGAEDVGA